MCVCAPVPHTPCCGAAQLVRSHGSPWGALLPVLPSLPPPPLLPSPPRSLFLGLFELWLLFPAAQLRPLLTGSHTPEAVGGLGCPQTGQRGPKQRKRAREWSALRGTACPLHWPAWGLLPSSREGCVRKTCGNISHTATPLFLLPSGALSLRGWFWRVI